MKAFLNLFGQFSEVYLGDSRLATQHDAVEFDTFRLNVFVFFPINRFEVLGPARWTRTAPLRLPAWLCSSFADAARSAFFGAVFAVIAIFACIARLCWSCAAGDILSAVIAPAECNSAGEQAGKSVFRIF
jgi:hypothetical protein